MLACVPGQGRDRPGQEQLSSRHRVRRVGARHVERAVQGRGQRLAQVVPDRLDGYPGAVPDPKSKNRIRGTVLELPEDATVLSQIDEYEGYDPDDPETSEFVRVRQAVELSGGGTQECWIYRYNREPER